VSGPVAVALDDGVAVVTVENPPVNALSNAVLDALGDAGERLGADPSARAVVLCGSGEKAFLAGADLGEFTRALDAGDRNWIEDHTRRSRRMLDRWEALAQPTVAAVQASAMGGGLEVALACDLIVADPSASFGLPEVRLGLMPGAGGTQRLPRRIGTARAMELALLGTVVDAERAHALGLVSSVSEPGAAAAEAIKLAHRLARLPAVSVRAIKRSVARFTERDLASGLDAERAAFMEVFASADAREGVRAFLDKRRPEFGHR
jgi:enoyl-CoA hydratase/carnithine racemase